MNKINQSLDKIEELALGIQKDNPYLNTLIEELELLERKLLKGLEEDERIKAQKQAS